jgi:hypothetical protein
MKSMTWPALFARGIAFFALATVIGPARLMPWAAVAPAIAGLPTFATDESAVKYFESGINGAGNKSSPPMPQSRFDHDGAVAVVAYLRSLKPPEKTGGQ